MPFTCALYLRQKIVFLIFSLQTLLKLKSTGEQSSCTVFGTHDGCCILIQMVSLFSRVGSIYYDIVNGGPFTNLSLFSVVVNYKQAKL